MYEYWISLYFKRQLKPLAKKYPHFKNNLIKALEQFKKNQGIALGRGLYKLRLKSSDIQRGKSKSFRLIIFILEVEGLIIPLTVYFKGDQQDISIKEINYHLAIILQELKRKQN